MTSTPGVTPPPKRSPSYPAFDLATSIDRVATLYAAERLNAAPIETVVKHWGYRAPNGRTNLLVSSLKKFGLIVDSGSGKNRVVQVSDAAVRILEHPDPGEKLAAIQKAALLPRIHTEMWQKYRNDLPTDATLIWNLKTDRDFTDVGAKDFVKEYRATIAFAQLGDSKATDSAAEGEDEGDAIHDVFDEVDPPEDGSVHIGMPPARLIDTTRLREAATRQDRQRAAAAPPPGMTSVPVPLPGGGSIVVHARFPISEANWNHWQAVLSAMKPGLVSPDSAIPAKSDTDGE
jgi:hypothetical protein